MSIFPWVPLYCELAEKLLPFETKQDELLSHLRRLRDEGFKVITLGDQDKDKRSIPLAEIDTFSFFASFNRGIRFDERIRILEN